MAHIDCSRQSAQEASTVEAAFALAVLQDQGHVRYAIHTVIRHFFMDQATAAAVARQRGAEVRIFCLALNQNIDVSP